MRKKQMGKSSHDLWFMCRVVAGCAVYAALSQPVCAVTKLGQTFTPYVGSSHIYDSNLLRAPEENDLELDSDGNVVKDQKRIQDSFIHQIRAGLNVDWRYSRQQVIVNAEVNHNWFTAFDLDYLGHDVLTQWNWVAGSRLKGEIGYKHEESLASFAQLGGILQQVLNNLQTEQRYFANAEYQIWPSLYFKAGYNGTEWRYDGEGRQQSNQTQHTGELSVQYRNQSRTMIGFRVAMTDGKYQRPDNDPSDNGFFRTSYNVDWEWRYSDKLRMGGLVGYLEQSYNHRSELNFSDAIASIDINWLPSEKTALVFSAWQQIDQAFTQNATFVLSQGVRVTPAWLPTAKIRVELPLSYEKQDYLGGNARDNRNPNLADLRSDDVVEVSLNVVYSPWVNTEFALKVVHENRESNERASSYQAQTVGINAKVEF